jgi:putative chitinase
MLILSKGSNNELVKKIQNKFNLTIDGDFGPQTEKSVIDWETKNGLKPNGTISIYEWFLLFDEYDIDDISKLFELNKIILPKNVLDELPNVIILNKINSSIKLSHFLGQCSHESNGFKRVVENLNYSKDRLNEVFRKYFRNVDASSYANNPEKIGNYVYANRMGNGSVESGEGFKFRGRGFLQLTGKDNYSSFSKFINEDCVENPDLVMTKYPLASASWYFKTNKIFDYAINFDESTFTKITKAINGGDIGLDERIKETMKFYKMIK